MQEDKRKNFYSGLHATDKDYSGGEYRIDTLFSAKGFNGWLQKRSKSAPLRILDVGCGKGLFLKNFLQILHGRSPGLRIEVTGVDLVQNAQNCFSDISSHFQFHQQNLDGETLPYSNESFDLLFCNHVLEHIFETEVLMSEFRRILHGNGLCVVSVPNTAAWVNRVELLFAGQPLGSEVGTRSVTYGFWPRLLQPKLEPFRPSGHIRDFTPRGLRDLASACGFQTVGWWAQSFGLLARLSKWAGRGIGIILAPSIPNALPPR